MRAGHAVGHGIQRVVSQTRAMRMEVIQTAFECLHHALQIQAVDAGNAGQTVHIVDEAAAVDVEHLVRTPCRIDLEFAGWILRDFSMIRQIVYRIVGGADDLDAELLNQSAAAEFFGRQHGIRAVPDILGGILVQNIGDAEHTAKLQVRPVIHGVADAVFRQPANAFHFSNQLASPRMYFSSTGRWRA